MPFITGYLSNEAPVEVPEEVETFQCPLSRATFQTLRCWFPVFFLLSVSMPFITGYLSNGGGFFFANKRKKRFQCPLSRATFQTGVIIGATQNGSQCFNALYHGLPFKPYLWICPNLLGVTATLRGSSNLFF